jgi:hypothetical protein
VHHAPCTTKQTREYRVSEERPSPDDIEPASSAVPEDSRGSARQAVDWFGLTESNLPPPPDGAAEAAEPVLQVPSLTFAGGLRP